MGGADHRRDAGRRPAGRRPDDLLTPGGHARRGLATADDQRWPDPPIRNPRIDSQDDVPTIAMQMRGYQARRFDRVDRGPKPRLPPRSNAEALVVGSTITHAPALGTVQGRRHLRGQTLTLTWKRT